MTLEQYRQYCIADAERIRLANLEYAARKQRAQAANAAPQAANVAPLAEQAKLTEKARQEKERETAREKQKWLDLNAFVSTVMIPVDLSKRALKSTFDTLGATAAFQRLFRADMDLSDEALAKAFGAIDTDGSRKISHQEMCDYLSRVSPSLRGGEGKKLVAGIIKEADANRDGQIE